jgi:formylglycine-generating enzyme required for sulfatase activity
MTKLHNDSKQHQAGAQVPVCTLFFDRSRGTSDRSQSTLAVSVARVLVVMGATIGLVPAQVGTNYCTPAARNSVGLAARIAATGTSNMTLNGNRLGLHSTSLPPNQFGFFLTSRTQGFVPNPGGSQGDLCLGGTVGRYVGPAQILNGGSAGAISLQLDLSVTPEGGSFVQVAAGETWNFQAWYRDAGPAGQPSSNLSDGLAVQFTAGNGVPIPGMVPIPAGVFVMGSDVPDGVPYFNGSAQRPAHQVALTSPFWMGQYEVTQAEYQAVMGVNPSSYLGASRPVERVSWNEARSYCAALNAQEAGNLPPGFEYRLPTEAEWEYACRAGTTTEFHYGQQLLCNDAWFGASYHQNPNTACNPPTGTAPVGGFAPNAFGLYDMHGNVWELCLDVYRPYTAASAIDPFFTSPISENRIIRGGAFSYFSYHCRSAYRRDQSPHVHAFWTGFRVVLAPILVP